MPNSVPWGDSGELWTHHTHVRNPRLINSVDSLKLGNIVAFIYEEKPRYVFVVTPNYFQKLHGLDLSLINHDLLLNTLMASLDITKDSYQFYNLICKIEAVQSKDAYRSYNIPKIKSLMTYDYVVPSGGDSDQNVEDEYTTPKTDADIKRIAAAEAKRARKHHTRLQNNK